MKQAEVGLACLGIPAASAKLASYFARNPTARPTVRELQRTLGIGSASAQRDLSRFVDAGAMRTVDDGRLLRYAPRKDSALWQAVRLLIGAEARTPTGGAVREKAAAKYGVDLSALHSNLRLTIEERLTRLDADASFLEAARANLKGRR
jgi:hypothetical protein